MDFLPVSGPIQHNTHSTSTNLPPASPGTSQGPVLATSLSQGGPGGLAQHGQQAGQQLPPGHHAHLGGVSSVPGHFNLQCSAVLLCCSGIVLKCYCAAMILYRSATVF